MCGAPLARSATPRRTTSRCRQTMTVGCLRFCPKSRTGTTTRLSRGSPGCTLTRLTGRSAWQDQSALGRPNRPATGRGATCAASDEGGRNRCDNCGGCFTPTTCRRSDRCRGAWVPWPPLDRRRGVVLEVPTTRSGRSGTVVGHRHVMDRSERAFPTPLEALVEHATGRPIGTVGTLVVLVGSGGGRMRW